MADEIILQALNSSKSTIIFGNLGWYAGTLEFYLTPYVTPRSDKKDLPPLWFLYKDQNIFLWVEPPFGANIPNRGKHLIFTSHLDLNWDPIHTQVISFHLGSHQMRGWKPNFQRPFTVVENVRDPSHTHALVHCTSNPHRTYLKMLISEDLCPYWKTWSLLCPLILRKQLKHHLERSWNHFKVYVRQPDLALRYFLPFH